MKKNLLTILFGVSIVIFASAWKGEGTREMGQGKWDKRQGTNEINKTSSCTSPHFSFTTCPLSLSPAPDTSLRIIHVYVALCDNDSQGIIPVPRKVGNGNDAVNNLYWGGKYGVKTFFSQSDDWELIDSTKKISDDILQRCVWKHRRFNTYLVADAYKGARIKTCTINFLLNVSGHPSDTAFLHKSGSPKMLIMENAKLVCYVGHDGFMDFEIPNPPPQNSAGRKEVFILSSASRLYFKDPILTAGGIPVLWTTNLVTPEAYTLKAAIDGWLLNESAELICARAAKAYDAYQKCGYETAANIFVTGY